MMSPNHTTKNETAKANEKASNQLPVNRWKKHHDLQNVHEANHQQSQQ